MMKKYVVLLVVALIANPLFAQLDIEKSLQETIDAIYESNPASIGVMVHVESPDNGISGVGRVDMLIK